MAYPKRCKIRQNVILSAANSQQFKWLLAYLYSTLIGEGRRIGNDARFVEARTDEDLTQLQPLYVYVNG